MRSPRGCHTHIVDQGLDNMGARHLRRTRHVSGCVPREDARHATLSTRASTIWGARHLRRTRHVSGCVPREDARHATLSTRASTIWEPGTSAARASFPSCGAFPTLSFRPSGASGEISCREEPSLSLRFERAHLSEQATREEPPSTLLARSVLPTGKFEHPTILKVAPPSHGEFATVWSGETP